MGEAIKEGKKEEVLQNWVLALAIARRPKFSHLGVNNIQRTNRTLCQEVSIADISHNSHYRQMGTFLDALASLDFKLPLSY